MPYSAYKNINIFDAKILIVDDNTTNIALLEDILDEEGYSHIFSTSDPRTVVDLYLEHDFDLVLLDIRMPHMDGHMVMRALREAIQDDYLPIIVLTAQTDSETRIKALENGAKDFLTKPFDPVEVHLRIRNMLEVRGFYRLKKESAKFLEKAVISRTRELAEQKASLQSIMDNAGEAILTIDTQGMIKTANRFAAHILKQELNNIVGQNIDRCFGTNIAMLPAGTHELLIQSCNHPPFSLELCISELDNPVHGKILIARDISARKQAEEKLAYLAHHDQLTGLANRRNILNTLDTHLSAQHQGALAYVAIDKLQHIHDTFGHFIVEKLLCAIAARMNNHSEHYDFFGTWESGEFIFLFITPNLLHHTEIIHLLENFIPYLKQPYLIDNHELVINYDIGISLFSPKIDPSLTSEKIIQRAALAHFFGKNQNPNEYYYFFHEHMEQEIAERHVIERELRHAIDRHQLELFYQPKIDLLSNQIMGAEALVRWRHPEFGLVPPLKFIPIAEETGLIIAIGRWVLERALLDTAKWQADFHLPDFNIAVNVSSHQFNAQLTPYVTHLLHQYHFNPKNLELEITESAIMRDIETALLILDDFRKLGIGLAIDDFGTGYSSLAYLRRLPITTLKIDASFIRDMVDESDAKAITATIIAMSQTLHLKTVAEGIETKEHESILKNLKCNYGQGYFFAKPMPASEFVVFLQKTNQLSLRCSS